MRLPLAQDIDSRDGTSNRDERLTNVLGEDNNGQQMATLRPGLATVATATGAGGGDAVERALAKLEAAAGAVASSESARVSVSIADDAAGAALATVSEALRSGRRVHLSYLVPSRDETTERDVDPMRLVSIESRWYLEGWCHRAEAVRLFRVDRIVAATVLDAAGAKPKQVVGRDLTAGLFVPDPTDLDVVTLDSVMSSGQGGGGAVVADACATSADRASVSASRVCSDLPHAESTSAALAATAAPQRTARRVAICPSLDRRFDLRFCGSGGETRTPNPYGIRF